MSVMAEKAETTRVVLADDHAVVRRIIRDLLNKNQDITVVGEASNGEEAVRLTKNLAPDVLLLDVEMPVLNGVEVAQKLKEDQVHVQILVLSAYDDQEYILELLASGAAGYLVKGEAPERIIEAVRGVAQGERGWVSPQVEMTLKKMREAPRDRKTITYRELEILRLVVQKESNARIALALGLSEDMVSRHIDLILSKLGVESREDAVVIALREGWI